MKIWRWKIQIQFALQPLFYFFSQMTVADLVFTAHTQMVADLTGSPVDWEKYPRLHALVDRVRNHPAILSLWDKRKLPRALDGRLWSDIVTS